MNTILTIYFPEDFGGRYLEYKTKILGNQSTIERMDRAQNVIPKSEDAPPSSTLHPEISVGDLVTFNDGTIRYKNDILRLRNQLKDLCRLFMKNHKRLVTIDQIRDEIIAADKRHSTPWSTIAKYVSELHNSLKIHFKRDIIFNQKEEGWYLQI